MVSTCDCNIGGSDTIALVVGNNLDLAVIEDTHSHMHELVVPILLPDIGAERRIFSSREERRGEGRRGEGSEESFEAKPKGIFFSIQGVEHFQVSQ